MKSSLAYDDSVIDVRDEIIRHYDTVVRFCTHLCGNYADGQDAAQVTMEKALTVYRKSPQSLPLPGEIKFWLFRIARNNSYDMLRRIKRRLSQYVGAQAASHYQPLTDGAGEILHAISQLPRQQKEVFILRQLHEYSTAEVSALLDIAEGTVKAHLKRAVDTLKGKLSKRNDKT